MGLEMYAHKKETRKRYVFAPYEEFSRIYGIDDEATCIRLLQLHRSYLSECGINFDEMDDCISFEKEEVLPILKKLKEIAITDKGEILASMIEFIEICRDKRYKVTIA